MPEEPVFVRSGWGTNRYVYNHRNPAGIALIFITPIVTIGVMIGFHSSSQWSEGELLTAVRKGTERLNGSTQYVSPDMNLGILIRDAVQDSGTGPGLGLDVARAAVDNDGHRYTVSTEDTDTRYCIRITMTRVHPNSRFLLLRQDHHLAATTREGPC